MEEKSIVKNKRIILSSIVIFVALIVILILLNSSLNSDVYFHYVYNQNTGARLSIITSLFLYFLFWWFAGFVPSAVVFLFMMSVYYFLHRKDKKVFDRGYHPEYEEEFYYGGSVAFVATYIVVLFLMILHLSNLVTINIF